MNDYDQDVRKVAAFHLHLRGPAVSWFNSLTDKSSAFKSRYFFNEGQNPTLFLEIDIFSNLKLLDGQLFEDFHSTVVEKGSILRNPDDEVLGKFISGLPDKLRLFVVAGAPKDMMTALTQAKLGEA